MNIAVFTDSFFPGIGGTEKAVLGFVQELSKKHNVLLVCPKYNGKHDDSKYNFKVVRTPNIKLTSNDYFSFPNFSINLRKTLLEFKPDIIHCQTVSPIVGYGIKFGRKHNIPVVMTIHTRFRELFAESIKFKPLLNFLIKNIGKKCYKANKVFTVSDSMAKDLPSYGYMGDVSVIRNGAIFEKVEDKQLNSSLAIEKYNLKTNTPILLFVGRMVSIKNVEFLLNAFKVLNDKNFKYKALLVGDGPDLDKFKDIAKKLNIENNVIFTGVINDKNLLSSIYSAADLFTSASVVETDSLVVVEAACHKTPSLVIDCSGGAERIKNNINGFISTNNFETYANKIIEIFKNKKELIKMNESSFTTIPKDWSETVNEYEKVYKTLPSKTNS